METTVVRTEAKEQRLPKESVLRDFVRFSRNAARGVAGVADAEGRALVDQMVTAGRITREEGEKLYAMLTTRLARSRAVFEERVDESIRKAAARVTEVTTRELERLASKVAELEAKAEKIATRK